MLYYAFHLHNSFMVQSYHTFFPYDMVWPHGAIFRYIGVYTITSVSLLSPHWPVFTHGSVWYVCFFVCPFVKYIVYWDI
jgi:hypothetical protein